MRVSFFIPEYSRDLPPPLLNRCDPPVSSVRTGYIRIFNIGALALMKRPLPITRTATRDLFDIVTLVQCGVVSHVQIFEWHNASNGITPLLFAVTRCGNFRQSL